MEDIQIDSIGVFRGFQVQMSPKINLFLLQKPENE